MPKSKYHTFQPLYIILLIFMNVHRSAAAPGHVFMRQGSSSFQFTIPEHSTERRSFTKDTKDLIQPEKIHISRANPFKIFQDVNEISQIPPPPSKYLRPPQPPPPPAKCSQTEDEGDPTVEKCKASIRTRQANSGEVRPRLLPRPISPVSPNMLIPIPRLIFPRHVIASRELDNNNDEPAIQHPRREVDSDPGRNPGRTQRSFQDQDQVLQSKFLEHHTEFHPMKSIDIFNQIRQQAKTTPGVPLIEKVTFSPGLPGHSHQNYSDAFMDQYRLEHPAVTYAQYKNVDFHLFKPHFPEGSLFVHRKSTTPVPMRQRAVPNYEELVKKYNTDFKNEEKGEDIPRQETTWPKYNVFIQRVPLPIPTIKNSPQSQEHRNQTPTSSKETGEYNFPSSKEILFRKHSFGNRPSKTVSQVLSKEEDLISSIMRVINKRKLSNSDHPVKSSSSKSSPRDGNAEIELYQKLLGILLTKLNSKNAAGNSNYKTIF